mmetsp:Transcript_86212/g.180364  ORF Transcript_86212/g.180364 Transcript_86212/m.180364 type:complete len:219 (-) Transcript_86212:2105-2761(-)
MHERFFLSELLLQVPLLLLHLLSLRLLLWLLRLQLRLLLLGLERLLVCHPSALLLQLLLHRVQKGSGYGLSADLQVLLRVLVLLGWPFRSGFASVGNARRRKHRRADAEGARLLSAGFFGEPSSVASLLSSCWRSLLEGAESSLPPGAWTGTESLLSSHHSVQLRMAPAPLLKGKPVLVSDLCGREQPLLKVWWRLPSQRLVAEFLQLPSRSFGDLRR